MIAKDLISDQVPVLHTSDTGKKALQLMETNRVSHLPIVNHIDFLGMISDNDIYDQENNKEPIGNYNLSLFSPFVYSDQHIYEVIALISKLNLTVIPVLNAEKAYQGSITLQNLVNEFSKLTAVGQPGGIIILRMNLNDYSLSEISRIIESNDAKVLSLYVSTTDSPTVIDVTIKVNSTNLTSIFQSFDRFNYQVRSSFMEDEELSHMLELRYEEFMKYLNM